MQMTTNRLEAFSDGVLAIIITIMVLEMEAPEGHHLHQLKEVFPTFLSYILSFIYIGIYWNNHHHLWQAVNKVNGKILWANLHLLFWLSLLPFTTSWMGNNEFSAEPVALYGFSLLMASIAWYILAKLAIKEEGIESVVGKAYRNDRKTILSMILYTTGIITSFFYPIAGCCIYVAIGVSWFIPDRRIEKTMKYHDS